MRSDLTDITLVIDRSGSMEDIQEDAQGGVNAFIERQSAEPGEAVLTLLQFDDKYEFIHNAVPIGDVPKYELVPKGTTALLDAVGSGIMNARERLAAMNEDDRPGLVIFVIVTDGLENASREFSRANVRKLIEHHQKKHKWHFTFLGANQDAFAEAGGLGISEVGAATYSRDKVATAYQATGGKVARMRSQSISKQEVSNDFTDEERKMME